MSAAYTVLAAFTENGLGYECFDLIQYLGRTYSPEQLHEAYLFCKAPPTGKVDDVSRISAAVLLDTYEMSVAARDLAMAG